MLYVQPRQYVLARSWTMLRSSTVMFTCRLGVSQDGDLGLTDVTGIHTKQKQNIQKPKKFKWTLKAWVM